MEAPTEGDSRTLTAERKCDYKMVINDKEWWRDEWNFWAGWQFGDMEKAPTSPSSNEARLHQPTHVRSDAYGLRSAGLGPCLQMSS